MHGELAAAGTKRGEELILLLLLVLLLLVLRGGVRRAHRVDAKLARGIQGAEHAGRAEREPPEGRPENIGNQDEGVECKKS